MELKPELVDAAEKEIRRRSENDPLLFLRNLRIASAQGPQLFDSCIADFQLKTFEKLMPSLAAVRLGRMPPIRRFWIERTKKASKDADIAAALLWLTAFPTRPLLVQVCAANQKQAGIIKRRAANLLHYNEWLMGHVFIQQNRILSADRMAEVVIESTDATGGGSHGDTPDVLILNELVHVARWPAMETHMANADGVPRGVVVVCTNAGIKGTRAHVWRRNAIANPKRWAVYTFSKKAPWLADADVEEARVRDPVGAEFARLWKGIWVSGTGGALNDAAIDACFRMQGCLNGPEQGWHYVAGLDLGVSHDHSGVVVLGVNVDAQIIRTARFKAWMPTVPNDTGQLEVDLIDVENACEELSSLFHIEWFGYDPAAGGSFMAQRLRKRNVPMREMAFSKPSNLTEMAKALVSSVSDGKLECYDDSDGRLRRDFGKFSITHRPPSNYKLEAVSDEFGHADVGTALVIALPEAIRMMGGWARFGEGDVIANNDDAPLSDAEVAAMPQELADIYNSGDGGC